MLIQFIIRTTFIKVLGNEYTGVSGLFTDILHVLSLMELGLDSSMVFSLYKPLLNRDSEKISALLNFYRKAFNLIGVLVLAAGVGCVPFLRYIVKDVPNISEDIRFIFLMYVAATGFSYFLIYKSILLRADQKSRIISNWSTIVTVAETVVEVILLVIFRKFVLYLIVRLIATVGRNLILSFITTRKYKDYFRNKEARLSSGETRSLLRDLACLTVYNVSGVIINSTDSIFISAFVGTVEVAIIGNFTLILNSLRTGINQIVNATKPSIGNLAATADAEKQELVFNRMNFISFFVSCFCCTCLTVLLNPFVGEIWFNESYKIGMPIIAALVINFFIAIMVFPVESFRTANGLFVQGWMRPAIMAVMNIVLDLFMGKQWGILGIFLATTISRTLTQVWYDPYLIYKIVFKKNPKKYFFDYILYALITAGCCAAAFLLANAVRLPNRYLNFLYQMVVAGCLPLLTVAVIFRKSDGFRYITRSFPKIKAKLLRKRS